MPQRRIKVALVVEECVGDAGTGYGCYYQSEEGILASRLDRFRNERGHLFQNRYQAISQDNSPATAEEQKRQ
jgi:hypothetical protein